MRQDFQIILAWFVRILCMKWPLCLDWHCMLWILCNTVWCNSSVRKFGSAAFVLSFCQTRETRAYVKHSSLSITIQTVLDRYLVSKLKFIICWFNKSINIHLFICRQILSVFTLCLVKIVVDLLIYLFTYLWFIFDPKYRNVNNF